MIDIKTAANELNNMLTDAVASRGVFVPVKKNLLQYKNYLIRKDDDGSWTVIYVAPQNIKYVLANTFLKISAFAVVKLHEKKRERDISSVIFEDKLFENNYTDSIYFKNIFKITQDDARRDNALWRYEIVTAKAKTAKAKIDRTFYRLIA
jgi:hypothetical protein